MRILCVCVCVDVPRGVDLLAREPRCWRPRHPADVEYVASTVVLIKTSRRQRRRRRCAAGRQSIISVMVKWRFNYIAKTSGIRGNDVCSWFWCCFCCCCWCCRRFGLSLESASTHTPRRLDMDDESSVRPRRVWVALSGSGPRHLKL